MSRELPVIFLIIVLILSVGFMLGLILCDVPCHLSFPFVFKLDDINYIDYSDWINNLEQKCGSTHIVKKFGSEDWYVFTRTCVGVFNDYCKYDYVRVEDCLLK